MHGVLQSEKKLKKLNIVLSATEIVFNGSSCTQPWTRPDEQQDQQCPTEEQRSTEEWRYDSSTLFDAMDYNNNAAEKAYSKRGLDYQSTATALLTASYVQ